jgi:E3 ubiquitin-protein ligase SDIR1
MAASEDEQSRLRPASSQHVQALPTCALDASQLEALPEESKECVICMEPFCEGDVLRTLPCLHRFHVGCIDRWFAQQGSCPICKLRLGDEDDHA